MIINLASIVNLEERQKNKKNTFSLLADVGEKTGPLAHLGIGIAERNERGREKELGEEEMEKCRIKFTERRGDDHFPHTTSSAILLPSPFASNMSVSYD